LQRKVISKGTKELKEKNEEFKTKVKTYLEQLDALVKPDGTFTGKSSFPTCGEFHLYSLLYQWKCSKITTNFPPNITKFYNMIESRPSVQKVNNHKSKCGEMGIYNMPVPDSCGGPGKSAYP